MSDVIETKFAGKHFSQTNAVLLEKTNTTALVFCPAIHPGGVRGELIRYKKVKNEGWSKMTKDDFRKLKLHEGTYIQLGTKELQKLCVAVEERKAVLSQNGFQPGEQRYFVSEKENSLWIDDENHKRILQQILDQEYSEEFWEMLNISNPGLADTLSAGHLQIQRKKVIQKLQKRLKEKYPETSGNDSWQSWIHKHNWLFGANYSGAIEKQKINISGVMPDYLFPTADGFVDILEIKLPSFEVIKKDESHKGSWMWSKEANQAIGQVVTYLSEIDRLRFEIEREIQKNYKKEILMLKPRAYILIGQSDDWESEKREGLRKLNHALHGVEIITYSDLVKRGEAFVESSVSV